MRTLVKVRANDVRQGLSCEAVDRNRIRRYACDYPYPVLVGHPVICKGRFNQRSKLYVLIVLLALVLLPVAIPSPAQAGQMHHYEYVFPDSNIYVYDIDNRGALVKHVSVPTSAGVRGAAASAVTGMLYISYGSNRRSGGSLLKYNLMTDEVIWTKHYPFGVDSMSISPDGNTIYMPTGEAASGASGKLSTPTAEMLPHQSIVEGSARITRW